MARLSTWRLAPLLLLVGFLTLPAKGQSPVSVASREEVRAPEDFGSDPQILVVGHTEFSPRSSAVETLVNMLTGTKWVESGPLGDALLQAPLNGRIPNGARITQICAYGVDDLAGPNVTVQLRQNHADAVSGADATVETPTSFSSSGAPGSFAVCQATDILVDGHQDVDNDGTMEVVNYNLIVFFGIGDSFGDELQIRFVRIDWQRQISPAPAFATFSDVPVGHPFHQFVEALAAAGVTAGCGGGNYCVDNPISRGEMAVFLAVALGLHWPAF